MAAQENLLFVIKHRIKPGHQASYEAWLKKIVPVAAAFDGHLGTHILRPSKGNDEYIITIRFLDAPHAQAWIQSPQRKELVTQIEDAFVAGDSKELKPGLDFWFTPASEKRPPAWKQWLLTTLIITLLTMTVPLATAPIFKAFPEIALYGVTHLINASIIVGLVTFFIMPFCVRKLHAWLYL
jgi:antibiotic biosynthesis monooxygenase (ABM) superfamily enzyme